MGNSIVIRAYGGECAAGRGAERLMAALFAGSDLTRDEFPRACSMRDTLVERLLASLAQFEFRPGGRVGVILASSKGCHEDWVWGEKMGESDGLTPVLDRFVAAAGLDPARRICISNACASTLSALFLAKRWLERDVVTDVLVAATEGVGPFVQKGFGALGALSRGACRPFAANRDGLRLGEATGVIWLSDARAGGGPLRLTGAGVDVEGFAVTRSSQSGASLMRAVRMAGAAPPAFILAHGTATVANDRVEDRAYGELFPGRPPISATKWCVGHALGASGLVDVIAACETLRSRRLFALGTTTEIDPTFGGNYALGETAIGPGEALVSSLGFGGVHAAVRISA